MYIKSGLLGYQGLKAPIAIDTRETKQIYVTLDKIFPHALDLKTYLVLQARGNFSSCYKPVSNSKF